jgi:hypothetical protein
MRQGKSEHVQAVDDVLYERGVKARAGSTGKASAGVIGGKKVTSFRFENGRAIAF